MGELETKSGYIYSAALHIGIAVAAGAFAFVGGIFKEPPDQPIVFQMNDPVPDAPVKPSETMDTPPVDVIAPPSVAKVDPVDIPDMSEPEPAPPEPEPEPAPTPSPKKAEKPKPVRPKPPKKISISEFRKTNPLKKPSRQRSIQSAQNVRIDKVNANTANLNRLEGAKISANAGASSAMKDALGAYVQYLNATAKRNWVIPDDAVGQKISCKIIINLSGTGAISGARIIQSSGNSQFDNSVIKIFQSLRVIPPPDGIGHKVTLIFTTET